MVAQKIKKRLEESKEDTKKRADKLADFARPKKDTKPPPLSEESAAAAEGPEAVHWAVNKESGQAKGIEGKALRIRLRRSRSRLYRRRLFQVNADVAVVVDIYKIRTLATLQSPNVRENIDTCHIFD